MKKEIIKTAKIIILGIALSAGIAFAQTWNAPSSNPTAGNIAAPINVSSSAQVKTGGLATGPLAVFGNSAIYGNVNILGAITSNSNNTQTGFLNIFKPLFNIAYAQSIATTSNLYVSGMAGMGVQNPTEKLDIAGNLKINSLSNTNALARRLCADTSGRLSLCPAGSISFTPTNCSIQSGCTWTVPDGVFHITVKVSGGGGGGGAAVHSTQHDSGGGGGGGYATSQIDVLPGHIFFIRAGAAGTPGSIQNGLIGASGGNGGPSLFANYLSATGGNGGTGSSGTDVIGGFSGTGGAGGTASGIGQSVNGTSGKNGGVGMKNYGHGGAGGLGGTGNGGDGIWEGSFPTMNPTPGWPGQAGVVNITWQ